MTVCLYRNKLPKAYILNNWMNLQAKHLHASRALTRPVRHFLDWTCTASKKTNLVPDSNFELRRMPKRLADLGWIHTAVQWLLLLVNTHSGKICLAGFFSHMMHTHAVCGTPLHILQPVIRPMVLDLAVVGAPSPDSWVSMINVASWGESRLRLTDRDLFPHT